MMLIKAFRLFVSSTFADFLAERGPLQDEVFPALDAYCATKGYQFLPLDLRWGVNEEANECQIQSSASTLNLLAVVRF